ncbi:MAG: four helix bundle protein [Bacteroidetes bacterium]|nr:four helix bundle protein [Bacteroidota bacterium]MBK7110212.1 four helix bundle protein [Bacteroidota bacterium]
MHNKNEENIILQYTFEFALKIMEYSEILKTANKYNMINQLFRSGTYIGANVREAQNAESRADFIHKMKIASKEAGETEYWLLLCKHSDSYPPVDTLLEKINVIEKILGKIIYSSKK